MDEKVLKNVNVCLEKQAIDILCYDHNSIFKKTYG